MHITFISYNWEIYTKIFLPLDKVSKFFWQLKVLPSPNEFIENVCMAWGFHSTVEELKIQDRTGMNQNQSARCFHVKKHYIRLPQVYF